MLENLTGWGVNGFGNPDGRGALDSGVTFDFIDVSMASTNNFSKIALRFQILLSFQTTHL